MVFALLPAVQQYAQEGRSYALVCAAVVAATLLLVRAWQRSGPAAWAGYGVAVLVAAVLHEFAVLAVVAHGLTLWWGRAPRTVRRGWALATTAALLALVPLVLISRQQADQVGWISTPGWSDLWAPALTSVVGALCACLPPVPGAAQAVVRLRAVALPLLVLPPAALILVSYLDPLYVDRYVLYSYAGLALLLGPVLDRVWSRLRPAAGRARSALSVAVLPVVLLALLPVECGLRSPGARPNDVAAAARAVRDLARPGDGVLFIPSARREAALYDPGAFAALRDLALAQTGDDSGTINGVEAESDLIRSALKADRVQRVVLVTDPKPRPNPSARDRAKLTVLAERFRLCRTELVHGLEVARYATPGACGDQDETAGQK